LAGLLAFTFLLGAGAPTLKLPAALPAPPLPLATGALPKEGACAAPALVPKTNAPPPGAEAAAFPKTEAPPPKLGAAAGWLPPKTGPALAAIGAKVPGVPKSDEPAAEVGRDGAAAKADPPLPPAGGIINGLLEPYSIELSDGEFIAIGEALRDPGSGVARLAEEACGIPSEGVAASVLDPNLKIPAPDDADDEPAEFAEPNVKVVEGAGGGSVEVGAFAPRPELSAALPKLKVEVLEGAVEVVAPEEAGSDGAVVDAPNVNVDPVAAGFAPPKENTAPSPLAFPVAADVDDASALAAPLAAPNTNGAVAGVDSFEGAGSAAPAVLVDSDAAGAPKTKVGGLSLDDDDVTFAAVVDAPNVSPIPAPPLLADSAGAASAGAALAKGILNPMLAAGAFDALSVFALVSELAAATFFASLSVLASFSVLSGTGVPN
jgi:hypothetical protein